MTINNYYNIVQYTRNYYWSMNKLNVRKYRSIKNDYKLLGMRIFMHV